jgi:hypothetical protein
VSAGGNLTCTLTITNTGNATLNNWAFNPAVSGCTPDPLVAGASHNCTVTEQVAEAEYAAWNASSPLAVAVDVEADAVQSEATPANVSRTASASLPFVPAPSTSPAASPESPSPSPPPVGASPSPSPDPVQPEHPVYVAAVMVALEDCSGPTEAGKGSLHLSVKGNC